MPPSADGKHSGRLAGSFPTRGCALGQHATGVTVRELIRSELARWTKAARDAGISAHSKEND